MKTKLLIIFLLFAASSNSQTMVVCNQAPPAGWITVSIGNCSSGFNQYISRTIRYINDLPVNTTLQIVGDVPPAGWKIQ